MYFPDKEGMNQYQSDSEWEEQNEANNSMLKLDDWINFCVDSEAAHLAFQLRQKWNATFLRRMRNPSKSWNPVSVLYQILLSRYYFYYFLLVGVDALFLQMLFISGG